MSFAPLCTSYMIETMAHTTFYLPVLIYRWIECDFSDTLYMYMYQQLNWILYEISIMKIHD